MRTIMEKIQDAFAAAAFAEAGEHETALNLVNADVSLRSRRVPIGKRLADIVDRHTMAVTFAEAGCTDLAGQYLKGDTGPIRAEKRQPITLGEFARTVGLDRARLHYGMASA